VVQKKQNRKKPPKSNQNLFGAKKKKSKKRTVKRDQNKRSHRLGEKKSKLNCTKKKLAVVRTKTKQI
jgi:hypothetical protein